MRLGLETESCHLLFQQAGMDIFSFIELTAELGLDGVQINVIPDLNLHPQWGTLDGNEPAYLGQVRFAIEAHGFFCEIDSRGTTLAELEPVLSVAKALGATLVRSYVRYPQNQFDADFLKSQIDEIRRVVPLLKKLGIRLALENHEFETSGEMIDFVRTVAEPEWVGLLCDTGNSMMAWEDPLTAIRAMAPYTFGVHFKDHTVVMNGVAQDGLGLPVVCGVPLGEGSIDLVEAYRILVEESTTENINLELCYPYCATFKRPPGTGGVETFHGAFALKEPPFSNNVLEPMEYYYPHKVGQEAADLLITRQLEDLRSSAATLLRLRSEFVQTHSMGL